MKNRNKLDQKTSFEEPGPNNSQTNLMLKGTGVSGGVGIGQAVVMERLATEMCPRRVLHPDQIPDEIERFEAAVKAAADQIKSIKRQLDDHHPLGEHLYILDTHILLLEDRMFFEGTKAAIIAEGINAEWALTKIMMKIGSAFDSIEDEYLRERARDIHFVGERVLGILMGIASDKKIHQLPPNAIIVAHDLSPADTAQITRDSVLGFAMDMGGRTSHTAIMAHALKIPAVTGLGRITRAVQTGDTIILDGSTGVVILNPDPEMIVRYRERQGVHRKYHQSLMPFGRLPAVTRDGSRTVRITANIELMDEIEIAAEHGAEGIGLFRTEYLFMGRSAAPSEDEQYEAYRHVLSYNNPHPVTIRTLDVGGDKIAKDLSVAHEINPALGMRAIRLCLHHRDLFKTQLRAVLRASVHGNCRLLIPMVCCLTELNTTRQIIEETKHELVRKGQEFDDRLKLGILVEVPAAVVIADLLASEVDFFSIGTNDLIQYALAIDRVNEQVGYLYDTLHPAILRLIRHVVTVGQARGIPVSMCGEMAGDPVNLPILLALGIDELSMNALAIPMVKKFIRAVNIEECLELAREVFEMQEAGEIRNFLENWIRRLFPSDYFVDQV